MRCLRSKKTAALVWAGQNGTEFPVWVYVTTSMITDFSSKILCHPVSSSWVMCEVLSGTGSNLRPVEIWLGPFVNQTSENYCTSGRKKHILFFDRGAGVYTVTLYLASDLWCTQFDLELCLKAQRIARCASARHEHTFPMWSRILLSSGFLCGYAGGQP